MKTFVRGVRKKTFIRKQEIRNDEIKKKLILDKAESVFIMYATMRKGFDITKGNRFYHVLSYYSNKKN